MPHQAVFQESGRRLGALCRDHFAATLVDFLSLLRQPEHPLRQLLVFVLYQRRQLRCDAMLEDVLHWLQAPPAAELPR